MWIHSLIIWHFISHSYTCNLHWLLQQGYNHSWVKATTEFLLKSLCWEIHSYGVIPVAKGVWCLLNAATTVTLWKWTSNWNHTVYIQIVGPKAIIIIIAYIHAYTDHRVLEEIDDVLEGRDYVSTVDLDKLQYMDQVGAVPFIFYIYYNEPSTSPG